MTWTNERIEAVESAIPRDVIRVLEMGPVVAMRLYPIREARSLRTGWFTEKVIEIERYPFERLDDEPDSDMPAMQRAVLMGLYTLESADDMGDWWQWKWRRSPRGDAALAALREMGETTPPPAAP